MSAANDHVVLGISITAIESWFGPDIETALNRYHPISSGPVLLLRFQVGTILGSFVGTAPNCTEWGGGAPDDRNEKSPWKPWALFTSMHKRAARSDPYGTRTRVAGVKGRSPRPLDEGAAGGLSHLSAIPRRN